MIKRIIFLFILPYIALELFSRMALFNLVPYVNSELFNVSIHEVKKSNDWDILALGSSEMLYGFNPALFDGELGIGSKSFNLGIEGFGPTQYSILLSKFDIREYVQNPKIVFIGINMIEPHDDIPDTLESGFDCSSMVGELHRSIFVSPFGKDLELAKLCEDTDIATSALESISYSFRHRKSLRALLLNGGRHWNDNQVAKSKRVSAQGQYQASYMDEKLYDFYIGRWKKQVDENEQMKLPMPPERWQQYVMKEGLFNKLAKKFENENILTVFVALPTNPIMIESLNKTDEYNRHSKLMQDWADKTPNISFLDVGIVSNFDKMEDFEDHRHLSAKGAEKFTKLLAALAKNDLKIVKALENKFPSEKY